MTQRDRNRRSDADSDWASQGPRREQPLGPYEADGWERGASALPEFRDSSAHRMPYERVFEARWSGPGFQGRSAPGINAQRSFDMQNQYNDDRERRRDERGFDEREVTGGQGHGWAYDRSQAGASRDWEYERNRSGSQSGMAGQNDTYRHGGIDSRGQAGASRDWEYERNRSGSQGGMAGQNDMYSPAGMAGSGYDREMGGQPNWASDDAWRVPGPHTGRGPQGYRRSDERIKEDVCERLTQHGQIDASGMQIDVKDCEVTLRGSVSDRRTKRMAEDVAEGVAGVRDVRNELRVGQDQGGLQQREAGSGNRS